MIKLELTQEQFNTVLQLIDIAIKAGGFANAKVAVPIVEVLISQAENSKAE